ncbi:hypothetical protein WA026_017333 [Henosepilachna vigintioctopunctata]|uniref:Uncharacterized protein n=1 Tax=Henosepilachna vigintioctopunctata TaxID=420089 RepID=A0AAW1UPQ5_9CUCU
MLWFVHTFKKIVIPIDKDILGEKKYKSIMCICMMLKISALVNYALAISAAFGIFISPEYYNSRIYLSFWIRKNFKNYSEYILFFMHMSNFPVAVALISLSIAMSYCSARAVFQFIIVNKVIEGICDSTLHPTERYDSKIYQAVVLQKLKICIMTHQLSIRLSLLGAEIMYTSMISISAGGVILGGSLLLEFFTHDISELSNESFAIVCFSLAGFVTSSMYGFAGQFLKDEVCIVTEFGIR